MRRACHAWPICPHNKLAINWESGPLPTLRMQRDALPPQLVKVLLADHIPHHDHQRRERPAGRLVAHHGRRRSLGGACNHEESTSAISCAIRSRIRVSSGMRHALFLTRCCVPLRGLGSVDGMRCPPGVLPTAESYPTAHRGAHGRRSAHHASRGSWRTGGHRSPSCNHLYRELRGPGRDVNHKFNTIALGNYWCSRIEL